jgi:hypothetical protein
MSAFYLETEQCSRLCFV